MPGTSSAARFSANTRRTSRLPGRWPALCSAAVATSSIRPSSRPTTTWRQPWITACRSIASWLLFRSSLSADLAACPLDTLSLVRYRLMSAAAASGSFLRSISQKRLSFRPPPGDHRKSSQRNPLVSAAKGTFSRVQWASSCRSIRGLPTSSPGVLTSMNTLGETAPLGWPDDIRAKLTLLLPVMYPGITCERSKTSHPAAASSLSTTACAMAALLRPASDGMSLIPETAWEMDSL